MSKFSVLLYRMTFKEALLSPYPVRSVIYKLLTIATFYRGYTHISVRYETSDVSLELSKYWRPIHISYVPYGREPDEVWELPWSIMQVVITRRFLYAKTHNYRVPRTSVIDTFRARLGLPSHTCVSFVAYVLDVRAYTERQLWGALNKRYGKLTVIRPNS